MITTVKPLGSTILERIGNTPLVRLDGLDLAHLPRHPDPRQGRVDQPRRLR